MTTTDNFFLLLLLHFSGTPCLLLPACQGFPACSCPFVKTSYGFCLLLLLSPSVGRPLENSVELQLLV